MSLEIEKVPAVAAILRKAEEDIRAVMGIKIILAVDAFEIKLKNKDILQRVVTDYYNATWEDIISHSRPRELSDAMFAYMYIARKVLKNTTTEIGKDCNRDHSTVIAAIKRVTNYYAINDGTSYDINVIEKRFLKKNEFMKIPIKLKASELTSLISLIEKSIPEKCTDRMEAIISLQMIRLLQTLKQRAIKLERPSLTINVEPDMAMSFVEFFYDYPIDCYSHAGNVVTKMINNYDQQTAQYF